MAYMASALIPFDSPDYALHKLLTSVTVQSSKKGTGYAHRTSVRAVFIVLRGYFGDSYCFGLLAAVLLHQVRGT
jgi:hypothetical protein